MRTKCVCIVGGNVFASLFLVTEEKNFASGCEGVLETYLPSTIIENVAQEQQHGEKWEGAFCLSCGPRSSSFSNLSTTKTRKAFNDFTRIMSQAGREEPRSTERIAGKHVARFRPQSMSLSLSLPAIWATAASGGCVGWIINELCRSAKSWYSLGQWPGTISLIWFGKTPRGRTRLKEITSQSINRK